jgi:heme exporter protein D
MTNLGYVLAAYGVAAVALLGLVAAIVLDQRNQLGAIRDLEARGTRRRSSRSAGQ